MAAGAVGLPGIINSTVLMPTRSGLSSFDEATGPLDVSADGAVSTPVDRGGYTGRVDVSAVGTMIIEDRGNNRRGPELMADQLTPTSAVRGRIHTNAGSLAALTASPADGAVAAPVVLLVPGYTGSKEDFAPLLDPLARAGFAAVAIDQPGQYESPGPEEETGYAPAVLGAALCRRDPRARRGSSVGAAGSFVRRARRPAGRAGRRPDQRTRPALLRACGLYQRQPVRRADQGRARPARPRGDKPLYDGGQRAAGLDPDDPAPLAQFYRSRFLASNPLGLLGMGQALLTEPDRTAELAAALGGTSTPVAVIAGEADDAWPLDGQRQMARTLGTELVLVPGGAHSPAIEAPDNLLAILCRYCGSGPSGRAEVTRVPCAPLCAVQRHQPHHSATSSPTITAAATSGRDRAPVAPRPCSTSPIAPAASCTTIRPVCGPLAADRPDRPPEPERQTSARPAPGPAPARRPTAARRWFPVSGPSAGARPTGSICSDAGNGTVGLESGWFLQRAGQRISSRRRAEP